MSLQLFAHPFSSYCQKVLIALYENDVAFRMRLLSRTIRPPPRNSSASGRCSVSPCCLTASGR